MRAIVTFLTLFLLATGTAVATAHGQLVQNIGEAPSCARCEIQLQHLFTVDDAAGRFGRTFSLSRNSRGVYYATDWGVTPGQIHVLSGTGAHLASHGREGRGPGEGRGVAAPVFSAADTGYAHDFMLQRVTVLSPENRIIRTFNLPGRISGILPASDGRLVVAGTIATRESAGWPLHIVDSGNGAVLRSFGSDVAAFRADAPALNDRRLAAAAEENSFWAAHTTRYVLERWDLSGRMLHQIRRNVSWFAPHTGQSRAGEPPPPYVSGIWVDESGLLWIQLRIADPAYRTAYTNLPRRGQMRLAPPASQDKLYDTILEVIDPRTGQLLASRRFDQFYFMVGGGGMHRYAEDADGNPRYLVYQTRLIGR